MSALTSDRNTLERVPKLRTLEAAAAIYAGSLVAVNADGKAVPASDSSGLVVIGCARQGAAIGEKVTANTGCFAFDGEEIDAGDIGKTVYVSDDHTVTLSKGTNGIKAGVVFDADSSGVWVKIEFSNLPPALSDLSDLSDLDDDYAEADHNHDAAYQPKATPAAAIADVEAAGEGSANLIAGLNGVLAVLRTNGLLASE